MQKALNKKFKFKSNFIQIFYYFLNFLKPSSNFKKTKLLNKKGLVKI